MAVHKCLLSPETINHVTKYQHRVNKAIEKGKNLTFLTLNRTLHFFDVIFNENKQQIDRMGKKQLTLLLFSENYQY